LIDAGDLGGAQEVASAIEVNDPWEWRAAWYRGIAELASERPEAALGSLTAVYHAVPGELAPKLALGMAAESAGDVAGAAAWYDVVSSTDPAYTTATFGLARCRFGGGDLAGALAAYERVAESSSSYTEARVASIRCLLDGSDSHEPELSDVLAAAAALEPLALDGEQRSRLTSEVFLAGLDLVEEGEVDPDCEELLLGYPFDERELRLALERSYREQARHASTSTERIRLVDEANDLRPRTWT
jgi:serine/threonine-protein kinase PknG